MQRRKNYKYQLNKYVEAMEARGKIKEFFDMSTILMQLFPLMPSSDRRDCLKYFLYKENIILKDDKLPPLTDDELKTLRDMFNFFDQDGSGFVDTKEILAQVHSGDTTKLSVLDSEFEETEKDVDKAAVSKLISSVDDDENAELDFSEFCKLFRGAF